MQILDTDILTALIGPRASETLLERIAALPVIYTTAITLAELHYGLERQGSAKLREIYETVILPNLTIVPFDEAAAIEYGRLRAHLETMGKTLSHPDLLVASIALAQGATLVTGQADRFELVTDLVTETW